MSKDDEVQNIMRSQYIYSYGPGSIIESVNGPRLIPKLSRGMPNFRYIVKKYEVHDLRLVALVHEEKNKKFEKRFFNLPSNSSEGKQEGGLCKTYVFPVWKICYGEHDNHKAVLFKSKYDFDVCPDCRKETDTYVRFICACPDGHMDEVPWYNAVHYRIKTSCKPKYFIWDANGSSLSDITIKCPECGEEKNMEQIYKQNHQCTGRFPETEFPQNDEDNVCYPIVNYNETTYHKMSIIQRQSTSLRIANTITLLKIPKGDKQIYDLFDNDLIEMFLGFAEGMSEKEFLDSLDKQNKITDSEKNTIKNYIKKYSYEAFWEKYINYQPGDDAQLDLEDIKQEEYEYLLKPHTKELHVGKSIQLDNHDFLKVAPVHKISLITAQISYQRQLPLKHAKEGEERLPPEKIQVGEIDIKTTDKSIIWYPVYDSYGEGIFISNTSNIEIDENVKNDWLHSYNNNEEDKYRNPYYVWWHTLSHALIRTLSYNAGYSSASIRERIYYNPANNKGGILLYTTSTGEDGSMGGLVGMVDNMDEVVTQALNLIENCSYDPLCSSSKITKEKVNGAACIYCLLLPETSCECNNKWLDKHVLLNE